MRAVLLCLAISFLVSCQPRRQPQADVLMLRELNELATVEYVVTKMIRANDNQTWYKVGDRKILMSCTAVMKAGIDFTRIETSSVASNDGRISLVLPRAQLLSINIRPEDIRTEYQETGLFRSEFNASEKQMLLAQGEAQLRNSVNELGILHAAEANASLLITEFLHRMGYKEVDIRYENGQPAGQSL